MGRWPDVRRAPVEGGLIGSGPGKVDVVHTTCRSAHCRGRRSSDVAKVFGGWRCRHGTVLRVVARRAAPGAALGAGGSWVPLGWPAHTSDTLVGRWSRWPGFTSHGEVMPKAE